jgi:hypothetical protein
VEVATALARIAQESVRDFGTSGLQVVVERPVGPTQAPVEGIGRCGSRINAYSHQRRERDCC